MHNESKINFHWVKSYIKSYSYIPRNCNIQKTFLKGVRGRWPRASAERLPPLKKVFCLLLLLSFIFINFSFCFCRIIFVFRFIFSFFFSFSCKSSPQWKTIFGQVQYNISNNIYTFAVCKTIFQTIYTYTRIQKKIFHVAYT